MNQEKTQIHNDEPKLDLSKNQKPEPKDAKAKVDSIKDPDEANRLSDKNKSTLDTVI